MLFVKENVTDKGFIVDNSDASVTRHAQPAYVALQKEADAVCALASACISLFSAQLWPAEKQPCLSLGWRTQQDTLPPLHMMHLVAHLAGHTSTTCSCLRGRACA